MMRKLPQYISQLFSCMLLFLLDVTVRPSTLLHASWPFIECTHSRKDSNGIFGLVQLADLADGV